MMNFRHIFLSIRRLNGFFKLISTFSSVKNNSRKTVFQTSSFQPVKAKNDSINQISIAKKFCENAKKNQSNDGELKELIKALPNLNNLFALKYIFVHSFKIFVKDSQFWKTLLQQIKRSSYNLSNFPLHHSITLLYYLSRLHGISNTEIKQESKNIGKNLLQQLLTLQKNKKNQQTQAQPVATANQQGKENRQKFQIKQEIEYISQLKPQHISQLLYCITKLGVLPDQVIIQDIATYLDKNYDQFNVDEITILLSNMAQLVRFNFHSDYVKQIFLTRQPIIEQFTNKILSEKSQIEAKTMLALSLSRLNVNNNTVWNQITQCLIFDNLKQLTFSQFRIVLGALSSIEMGTRQIYLLLKQEFYSRLQAQPNQVTSICFAKILRSFSKNAFSEVQVISDSDMQFYYIENYIEKNLTNFIQEDLLTILNFFAFIGAMQSKIPNLVIDQININVNSFKIEDINIIVRSAVLFDYKLPQFWKKIVASLLGQTTKQLQAIEPKIAGSISVGLHCWNILMLNDNQFRNNCGLQQEQLNQIQEKYQIIYKIYETELLKRFNGFKVHKQNKNQVESIETRKQQPQIKQVIQEINQVDETKFDIILILKAADIQFIPEFIIGPYNVDIFIPNYKQQIKKLQNLQNNVLEKYKTLSKLLNKDEVFQQQQINDLSLVQQNFVKENSLILEINGEHHFILQENNKKGGTILKSRCLIKQGYKVIELSRQKCLEISQLETLEQRFNHLFSTLNHQ